MSKLFKDLGDKKPVHSDPTADMLYEYEKYYMQLVKDFRHEIEFIDGLHAKHAQEVKKFYCEDLPAVRKKLESEPIENDVRNEWIKHLEGHMDKSFTMSRKFLDALTTEKVEEFNESLREKIFGSNVS